MSSVVEYVRKNPARVYAVVVAVLALVGVWVALPVPEILAVVAALLALGGGEVVQRVENRKTTNALHGL